MLIYLLATASNNTKKNSANAAVQSQSDVAKNLLRLTRRSAPRAARFITLIRIPTFSPPICSAMTSTQRKKKPPRWSRTPSAGCTLARSLPPTRDISVNYLDGTVFVPSTDVMPVSTSVILPLGSISQIIQTGAEYDYETGDEMPQFTGYSGCGPACLYMLATSIGAEPESHHCRRKPYHQLRRACWTTLPRMPIRAI